MQRNDCRSDNLSDTRRRTDARSRLAAADKQLRLAREQVGERDAAAIAALQRDLARVAPLRFDRASELVDRGDGIETDGGQLLVPEDELFAIYSDLADATQAAACGDPNECASKAADAKRKVMAIHEDAETVDGGGQ